MKYTPFTAAGIGILALLGSLSGSWGETASSRPGSSDSAKDRAKWRLATLSAAREILDELNHPAPLGPEVRAVLIERLNGAMRKDVVAHASRAASQRLCGDIAIRMRREDLDRRFRDVTAHANEQSPIPVLWTDVTSHLGAGWSNTLDQALQSFAGTELVPLFSDSRARAVGLLRQELEQQLRFPSEKELNDILGELLARHPDTLRLSGEDDRLFQEKVVALAHPDRGACFEELQQPLNDLARRVSTEVRGQYERQRACLETTAAQGVPDDRRQASAIGPVLLGALEAALAGERAKPGTPDVSGKPAPLYPLLSPIRDGVPGVAARVETERFSAFLDGNSVLAIQADPLAGTIRSEPETHHTRAASEAVFMKSLTPALQEKAAVAYAAGANPAGAADYFKTLLSTNPALAGVLQSRVTRELPPRLLEARRVVCDEQYGKTFAALEERRSVLSQEALASLQDSGGAALTSLADALTLLGVAAPDRHTYLEETVDRVLALANRQAREGYDVLTAQMGLLRKLEQDRLDRLRQEVAARRPFKEIRAEWQTALETAWRADARARTTPYKDVLDLTLANLNKTVRQLYDSIQENPNAVAATPSEERPAAEAEQGRIKELRQDPARPEDRNPEQPKDVQPPAPQASPKAGGSEGAANTVLSRTRVDRRNEPDGILLLTGSAAGSATARLLGQDGTATCTASFDPGKPQDAAAGIFNAMQPSLKSLWTGAVRGWEKEHSGLGFLKRRTPPKLKLFVVIESEEVRHRMSLLLRQRIEDAMADWGQGRDKGTPDVELDWKVGLTFDPAAPAP